jgi:hypothetical protein
MAQFGQGWAGNLIQRSAVAYARAHGLSMRALEDSRVSLQGFLSESLRGDELSALTQQIFARRDTYGAPGLFAWERVWYQRDLPPPPAHVLVGGCGSGREMLALIDAGYEVSGFEPTARLYGSARLRLHSTARIWQLRYEDLVSSRARDLVSRAPYAAVILGWTSFSHVIDAAMRARVIETLRDLCPTGPLLLSFHQAPRHERSQPRKTLERRARSLGRAVGWLRRVPRPVGTPPVFLPHCGFIHRFTDLEIEHLARLIGRRVSWGDDLRACPHCSFQI